MAKNKKSRLNPGVRHILGCVSFTIIACAAVFYLFYTGGLFAQFLHVDLSLLVLPLIGYYTLRLFSRLSGYFIKKPAGALIPPIINGLAIITFSYYFFGQITLLTHIPSLSMFKGLTSRLSEATPFIILICIGITVSQISVALIQTLWGRRTYPVSNAIGQLLIGLGVWKWISSFSGLWSPASGIGFILLVAMSSLALANLSAYTRKAPIHFIADPSKWLRRSHNGVFLLGALSATYFIFIRPGMAALPYSQIIEWAIVCFVAWRLLTNVKNGLEAHYSVPVKEANWQKHVQQVDESVDDNFVDLCEMQKRFVDESKQDEIIGYLNRLLNKNGIQQQELGRIISPIADYHDRKPPWYTFGRWRKRILKNNRRNRQNALNNIVKNLEAVAHPTYKAR